MPLPHFETDTTITVLLDGTPTTYTGTDRTALLAAIMADDTDAVRTMLFPVMAALTATCGMFTIKATRDGVLCNGTPLHNAFTRRICQRIAAGIPVGGLLAAVANIEANPHFNVRQQLYAFIDRHAVAIDDDGMLHLYKGVKHDYAAAHVPPTGPVYWHVGTTVRMDPRDISTDPAQTCAPGLHVAIYEYVGPGGMWYSSSERWLHIRVNPMHVMRIPCDHGMAKVAVCEAYVVADITDKLHTRPLDVDRINTPYDGSLDSDSDDDSDDDDDDDDVADTHGIVITAADVGRWVRLRNGMIQRITRIDEAGRDYPVELDNSWTYETNGEYFTCYVHPRDIVAFVDGPAA